MLPITALPVDSSALAKSAWAPGSDATEAYRATARTVLAGSARIEDLRADARG